MKKVTFLRKLKQKLSILEPTELEDILSEYKEYIEEKMESGMTEEEAVSSFGDVEELGTELLKTYRRKMKKTPQDPIGDFSKKVMSVINEVLTDLSEKSTPEIVKFFLEMCFIVLMILLFRIPFSLMISLGRDIFNILSSPLNRIFFLIWRFVLEFSYAIISIVVFVRIFDRRYLQNKEKIEEKSEPIPKNKKKEVIEEKNVFKDKPQIAYICETLIKICVFFLKFFAVFILFGISVYLIGMTAILGICIYLIINGVTYFGIYLVMFSLFTLGMILFCLLYNFVIDKKTNGVLLFINLFVSMVLLGGGCVLATFEVSETEFINGVPNDLQTETLTEELSMTKDTVFIGNIAHYNIDNNLSTVKVEYQYYPLGTTMSTDVKKDGNFVYLRWNLQKIHVSMDLLNHIVHDLKEKKVYNYYIEPTIFITANEENIEKIRNNRQKYYENEKNYTSCNFVRTYTVEMIKEIAGEKEYVVVLSEYLEDDLVSVHLKKEWASNLEVGSAYEFTFQTFQQYIDTDIEDVFRENEVVGVKKTDKVGIEQRQDYACTIFY